MASEFERIARLEAIFGPPPPAVSLGIGDDAAVLDVHALSALGAHLVWTVDSCVEDVHFRRDLIGWYDLGWKSFMAAASDLAAMGASPLGALCALCLPPSFPEPDVDHIAAGQAAAAAAIGTAVIGGNLSRAREVSLATTLLGSCSHAPRRNGARPGELLVAAGPIGLAATGLRALLDRSRAPGAERAIEAWRRPIARISDGLLLARCATALIDISDGLAQDADHLAQASRVRIDLDPAALVPPELHELCARLGLDPLAMALGGGEDYALIATVPDGSSPEGARVIGHVIEGDGVWLDGRRLAATGFDHFREG